MLVYPIPHAVTQARVQLVADQTEKAPSHVIQADVLNVYAAKNEASRQALAQFKQDQAKEIQAEQDQARKDHVQQDRAPQHPVQQDHVREEHLDVKA